MYVAIEGCIAAGKSTTAELVAEDLGWPLMVENTAIHPFLDDFYSDPERYNLETELAFVLLHYHQLYHQASRPHFVTDFSPVKDLVFGRMNLSGQDLTLFENLYRELVGRLPLPDLALFLDLPVETRMRRIKERGRPTEMNIPLEYVERLTRFYQQHLDELGSTVRVINVGPKASPETVAAECLAVVQGLLQRPGCGS